MALINTAVPNLIQGVSQQPDPSRYPGQCDEQENALSSVARGLLKRPNTRHIGKLITSAIGSDSFVHFINRSESERYVVITYKEYDSSNAHTNCKIRAFNLLDGTEASITVGGVEYNSSFLNITNPDTGANYTQSEIDSDTAKLNTSYTLDSSNTPYLHANNPRDDLKALSIGDTTLILNKSVGVGLKKNGDSIASTPALEKKALIFLKQGDFTKKYSVTITGGIIGGAGSSITLNFTRYTYSQSGSRPPIYYYRYRVSDVTVNNGGANHSANLSLVVTSSNGIYTQPVINFNVVGGVIQPSGHTIVNGGDFAGVGNTYSTYYNANIAYGVNPPTVNATIVDGTPASGNAPVTALITSEDETEPEHADTDRILERLVSTNDFSTDLTDVFSSSYYIKKNDNTNLVELLKKDQTQDFNISVADGLAGDGIGVVYKEVGSITDLPTIAPDGYVVKVRGDIELDQDDFYVKFETKNGQTTTHDNITSTVGEGSWIETVAPEVNKGIDNSTMPYSLINNAVNNFVLEETNFEDRLAGDDLSNPLPSFVGSEIEAMFFFKNRLGFLSKENVIMSEAGFGAVNDNGKTVFNFGRTSVTTLLDSAPIDISVASSRVTTLKSAKGFQENLVLFAENGQFVLKSGEILTAKNVSVTPITNFSVEDNVEPLPLGSYLYFPFTRGNFTGLREFTVTRNTDNYDSVEVTEHVPSYIPAGVIAMTGTTSEDIIALLSDTTYSDGTNSRNSLYIYNYFWNNNQKILSAWSKFSFDGEIVGLNFMDSTLYMVLTKNGETNLVEMPLEAGLKDAAGFNTYLDMRVEKTVSSGNSTITLPYTPTDNSVEVYTTDGLKLNCTNLGATVTLTQAVTADTDVFVGVPYTMKYTFSEQLFKAKAGNGTSPSNAANLMVRNGSIYFDDTAFFKVKVTPQDRQTYENVFTPDVVGATTIGSLNLDSGFFRFPVFTKPQDTTITIENDSALPSNFQSAEFESFVHSRSNRYG